VLCGGVAATCQSFAPSRATALAYLLPRHPRVRSAAGSRDSRLWSSRTTATPKTRCTTWTTGVVIHINVMMFIIHIIGTIWTTGVVIHINVMMFIIHIIGTIWTTAVVACNDVTMCVVSVIV